MILFKIFKTNSMLISYTRRRIKAQAIALSFIVSFVTNQVKRRKLCYTLKAEHQRQKNNDHTRKKAYCTLNSDEADTTIIVNGKVEGKSRQNIIAYPPSDFF